MQYIERSSYPVSAEQRFIDQAVYAATVAAADMARDEREALYIAYNALDMQYGSVDDAIILIEDTVFDHEARFAAIEQVYRLNDLLEAGEWSLGDRFSEVLAAI